MSGSAKTLIVLVGPTAVGKTALSIKLAKELGCPIISTDSRQFYREMNIGTAKPSTEELAAAVHHFVNSRSIHDRYTAGMFEEDAISKLDEIYATNNYCIAVGGSGLYINALCYGIDDIPSDEGIRELLHQRWQSEGLEVLREELKQIDPDFYQTSDMKNPRRVMRGLEVYQITGSTYSSFRKRASKSREFNIKWVGLEMEIPLLYERINQRVDQMMERGLLEEVEGLADFLRLKALRTVGYQEFTEYFEGTRSLEEVIELVKRNSRRFAKKQFTWFRKNSEIKWFKPNSESQILSYIQANN